MWTPALGRLEEKMANGIEDLNKKNKDEAELKDSVSKHFDDWRVFQGHEDAEMLQEKSAGWSSKKASRGDYDDWDE